MSGPIVTTLDGKIRGLLAKSRDGVEYHQFLGIKYAQPPVQKLRFQDPQPVPKFDGIFEATKFGPECLQFEGFILNKVMGQEDALTLNLFVPKPPPDTMTLLPVMVFLHGGAFMSGSSTMYKGSYFVDEGVILVTLNYRLGALGFLSSGSKTSSSEQVESCIRGNFGLKDQTLALKWIKDNIKLFGGDPENVTLFGESAGACCAHYQQISPMGKNLFARVISMSGTAFQHHLFNSDLEGQFKNFAAKLKCPTTPGNSQGNLQETIDWLKNLDGKALVEGHRDFGKMPQQNEFAAFAPTIEVNDDALTFLPSDPKKLVEAGNFQKIPWIAGLNKMEGLLYVAQIVRDPEVTQQLNKNWLQVLPKLLKYDSSRVEVTRQIKEFYFGNSGENLDVENNIEKFSDLFSDRIFFQPVFHAARIQSKFSPVYVYYLTYKPKSNLFDMLTTIRPNSRTPASIQFVASMLKRWFQKSVLRMTNQPSYGPGHADELSLLFNMNFFVQITDPSHADYEFSRSMVKLWANLAKGDEKSYSFNGHPWHPVKFEGDDTVVTFMELDVNGQFKANPDNEEITKRMKFWDSLNL